MRIRTIKPEFWSSEGVASCSGEARLTFIGLWQMADDHGNGKANPKLVKAALWPLDEGVTADDVAGFLDELEAAHLIQRYEAEDRTFFHVPAWEKHQAAAYRRGEPQHPAPTVVQISAGREGNVEGNREGKGVALRERDELFEAVAEVCGIDWNELTDSARGSLNKAVAQLRGAHGGADEVRVRAANWPALFDPDTTLTPTALAKYWPQLKVARQTHGKSSKLLALADRMESGS